MQPRVAAFVERIDELVKRLEQHIARKGDKNIAPEVMEAMGLGKKSDAAE